MGVTREELYEQGQERTDDRVEHAKLFYQYESRRLVHRMRTAKTAPRIRVT